MVLNNHGSDRASRADYNSVKRKNPNPNYHGDNMPGMGGHTTHTHSRHTKQRLETAAFKGLRNITVKGPEISLENMVILATALAVKNQRYIGQSYGQASDNYNYLKVAGLSALAILIGTNPGGAQSLGSQTSNQPGLTNYSPGYVAQQDTITKLNNLFPGGIGAFMDKNMSPKDFVNKIAPIYEKMGITMSKSDSLDAIKNTVNYEGQQLEKFFEKYVNQKINGSISYEVSGLKRWFDTNKNADYVVTKINDKVYFTRTNPNTQSIEVYSSPLSKQMAKDIILGKFLNKNIESKDLLDRIATQELGRDVTSGTIYHWGETGQTYLLFTESTKADQTIYRSPLKKSKANNRTLQHNSTFLPRVLEQFTGRAFNDDEKKTIAAEYVKLNLGLNESIDTIKNWFYVVSNDMLENDIRVISEKAGYLNSKARQLKGVNEDIVIVNNNKKNSRHVNEYHLRYLEGLKLPIKVEYVLEELINMLPKKEKEKAQEELRLIIESTNDVPKAQEKAKHEWTIQMEMGKLAQYVVTHLDDRVVNTANGPKTFNFQDKYNYNGAKTATIGVGFRSNSAKVSGELRFIEKLGNVYDTKGSLSGHVTRKDVNISLQSALTKYFGDGKNLGITGLADLLWYDGKATGINKNQVVKDDAFGTTQHMAIGGGLSAQTSPYFGKGEKGRMAANLAGFAGLKREGDYFFGVRAALEAKYKVGNFVGEVEATYKAFLHYGRKNLGGLNEGERHQMAVNLTINYYGKLLEKVGIKGVGIGFGLTQDEAIEIQNKLNIKHTDKMKMKNLGLNGQIHF